MMTFFLGKKKRQNEKKKFVFCSNKITRPQDWKQHCLKDGLTCIMQDSDAGVYKRGVAP